MQSDAGAWTNLTRHFELKRVEQDRSERVLDTVALEEPLQIRLRYWFKDAPMMTTLALTMRTPGHDREFIAGYLLSEGIIGSGEDIRELRPIGPEPSNEIVAELSPSVDVDTWQLTRNGLLNSSCGICGKRSLETLAPSAPSLAQNSFSVDQKLVASLPQLLRGRQQGFENSGGLHAAALVSAGGEIKTCFEDIGRHNALDKLIGHEVLYGTLPLSNRIVFLSSRSSFELVQKTFMAGAPVLATVGAPSSLAIQTARGYGMTLIGFIREGRFNIYSGEWRLQS